MAQEEPIEVTIDRMRSQGWRIRLNEEGRAAVSHADPGMQLTPRQQRWLRNGSTKMAIEAYLRGDTPATTPAPQAIGEPVIPQRGHEKPNTCQFANALWQVLIHKEQGLSDAELRVYIYISAHTLGFGKASDTISMSQLHAGIVRKDGYRLDWGTGLSIRAISTAVKMLVERGLLEQYRNTDDTHGHTASTYRLRFEDDGPL